MEELSDFKRRLENHFPRLTKSEKRIASFLLANHDEAAFLPAGELQTAECQSGNHRALCPRGGVRFLPRAPALSPRDVRLKVTPASRLQRKLADSARARDTSCTRPLRWRCSTWPKSGTQSRPADFDRAVEIIARPWGVRPGPRSFAGFWPTWFTAAAPLWISHLCAEHFGTRPVGAALAPSTGGCGARRRVSPGHGGIGRGPRARTHDRVPVGLLTDVLGPRSKTRWTSSWARGAGPFHLPFPDRPVGDPQSFMLCAGYCQA